MRSARRSSCLSPSRGSSAIRQCTVRPSSGPIDNRPTLSLSGAVKIGGSKIEMFLLSISALAVRLTNRGHEMANLLWIIGLRGFAPLACAQVVHTNTATLPQQLRSRFESKLAHVNGTQLHYARGGSGPAVVLLHGFPVDWYEFHLIMPRLAKHFTVVAVDLRGVANPHHRTVATMQRTWPKTFISSL